MKVLLFFLLAIVGTLSAPADVAIEPQIIGGVNALPGEFPYIVSLQWVLLTSSQHVCGGTYLYPKLYLYFSAVFVSDYFHSAMLSNISDLIVLFIL